MLRRRCGPAAGRGDLCRDDDDDDDVTEDRAQIASGDVGVVLRHNRIVQNNWERCRGCEYSLTGHVIVVRHASDVTSQLAFSTRGDNE
ncbi:unnamed protein product [Danaus chrysippus]|uniref:(African queen) hypothetical protein n=1 Tax=Danaus chrysippus TaxID=151541 RepID=A0A8J2R5Y4_9NEOP|nr:unnamed protein product [Danaus chrysippus]